MAKKRKVTTKRAKRVSKKVQIDTSKKKFNFVVKNLILFSILFIASFLLYVVSTKAMYQDSFGLLAITFGFISLAYLIVFLILLFKRFLKK